MEMSLTNFSKHEEHRNLPGLSMTPAPLGTALKDVTFTAERGKCICMTKAVVINPNHCCLLFAPTASSGILKDY